MLIRENTVWVGLEYFVDEGDQLWNMSDEDLIQVGIKKLSKLVLSTQAITSTVVPFGCPRRILLILGPTKRYPSFRDYVSEIENLFLIGRNGMHRYNNQDHSMLVAMQAVDGIVEDKDNREDLVGEYRAGISRREIDLL